MHQKLRFVGPTCGTPAGMYSLYTPSLFGATSSYQLNAALCQQLLQGREVCRNLAKLFGRIGVQALVIVRLRGVGHIL